jgi:hypothetical protein
MGEQGFPEIGGETWFTLVTLASRLTNPRPHKGA